MTAENPILILDDDSTIVVADSILQEDSIVDVETIIEEDFPQEDDSKDPILLPAETVGEHPILLPFAVEHPILLPSVVGEQEPFTMDLDLSNFDYKTASRGGFFLIRKLLPNSLYGTLDNGVEVNVNLCYLVEETVNRRSYKGKENEETCKVFNIKTARPVIRENDPLPPKMATRIFAQTISIPVEMVPKHININTTSVEVYTPETGELVNVECTLRSRMRGDEEQQYLELQSTYKQNTRLTAIDCVLTSSDIESLGKNDKRKLSLKFPNRMTSLGKGTLKYKTAQTNAVIRVQFKNRK